MFPRATPSRDRWTAPKADPFQAMASGVEANPATDLTPPAQDVSGLHPNASGYPKMAQVWYDTLVQEGLISRCP